MMKSKVVVEQLEWDIAEKGKNYRVLELTNRTTPKVDSLISEKEIQGLLVDGRGNITVIIKKQKK